MLQRFFAFVERNKHPVYRCLNLLGVAYSMFMVVALATLNIFHTCPTLYGEDGCRMPIVAACFLLFQVCSNLLLVQLAMRINKVSFWTLNSSSLLPQAQAPPPGDREPLIPNGNAVPSEVTPGRFCYDCNTNVPMRSHHCPLCLTCVLRCDHHCFMTGACIGIGNQRYFVVFLFWVCVGATYAISYMLAYMNHFVAPVSKFGYVTYVAPFAFVQWVLGNEPFFHVFLAVLLCISVSATVAAIGFLSAQIFYISKGYTMYDYHTTRVKHNLVGDGGDLKERLALVFGKNWWANFIVPQFWNPNVLTPEIARNIFSMTSKDV